MQDIDHENHDDQPPAIFIDKDCIMRQKCYEQVTLGIEIRQSFPSDLFFQILAIFCWENFKTISSQP